MSKTIDYGDRGTVIVYPDAQALANAAAGLFRSISIDASHDRGQATIALSGGSTPKAMGAVLAQPPFLAEIPWGSTHFFWGDERWVPLESPESNAGEAKRGYLDIVPVPSRNIQPFTTSGDEDESAAEYEAIIRTVVAGRPIPIFDLVLLGMGDDGHTASLFPQTEALGEQDRLVVPNYVPKFDSTRLTFTVPLINAARAVVFLAAGDGKSERLSDVLDGELDPLNLPAQLISPTHGTLTWLVDEAAADKLKRNQ